MMTDEMGKRLFDGGKVRLTWNRWDILVEELPRKPCKTQLESWSVNTYYAVQQMRLDDYIPSNIIERLAVSDDAEYDDVVFALVAALAELNARPWHEKVQSLRAAAVSKQTRHYAKVVPEGVEKRSIPCKDFILTVEWTKFSAYSPNSDFQQADPHYTQIHETSAAAARKLYKLAQDKQEWLAGLPWNAFSDWLRLNKVNFGISFSQWT